MADVHVYDLFEGELREECGVFLVIFRKAHVPQFDSGIEKMSWCTGVGCCYVLCEIVFDDGS